MRRAVACVRGGGAWPAAGRPRPRSRGGLQDSGRTASPEVMTGFWRCNRHGCRSPPASAELQVCLGEPSSPHGQCAHQAAYIQSRGVVRCLPPRLRRSPAALFRSRHRQLKDSRDRDLAQSARRRSAPPQGPARGQLHAPPARLTRTGSAPRPRVPRAPAAARQIAGEQRREASSRPTPAAPGTRLSVHQLQRRLPRHLHLTPLASLFLRLRAHLSPSRRDNVPPLIPCANATNLIARRPAARTRQSVARLPHILPGIPSHAALLRPLMPRFRPDTTTHPPTTTRHTRLG